MPTPQSDAPQSMDQGREISGKRLLPALAVGCLIYCVVMGLGTYLVAQWTTPYLKARAEAHERERREQRTAHPNPNPSAKPSADTNPGHP